jgi:predicted Rossmann fold flavoprotein
MSKIAIIGAGAAGLIAAGTACEYGHEVTVFDPNGRAGVKLMITGKGRCNVTNNSDVNNIIANIPTNPRFMYGALSNFTPADTIDFFENLGVKLKTERGARVFPESDRAKDIVEALKRYASGAEFIWERVTDINTDDGAVTGVKAVDRLGNIRNYDFDSVILCTGGVSYPRTGSTGDGYKIAKALGHTVITPKASLVPLEADKKICAQMSGLAMKNVVLKIRDNTKGNCVYEEFGEMLFAHFGITGPIVLSASSHLKEITHGKYSAVIDLKPALDEKTLDTRLLSDFSKNINKNFSNSLDALLPQKMIPVFIKMSGIDPFKKVNLITKDERQRLVQLLKNFEFDISGFRPIDEAIITSGGINIKEISPKDMQSKLIAGLYFAGEVIDVDAYTGGFNLQIAFSTAKLAAESASQQY